MTTIPAPARASTDTKATLLAYLDALALAEPIQARLWQVAAISLSQVQVLRSLLREGPQTLSQLGHAFGLSPASATRIVDRLERRGLVTRRRESDDRRMVRVRIAPTGERLMGEIKLMRGTDIHQAVEAMTPEERTQLTASLRRLVQLARQASRPAEQGE